MTPNAFTTRSAHQGPRLPRAGAPRSAHPATTGCWPTRTGVLRAEVRRRLGVRDGQRAVLYAPTWRENARARGHHEKVLLADPADLAARLGDAVVLVRGHPNTAAVGLGLRRRGSST